MEKLLKAIIMCVLFLTVCEGNIAQFPAYSLRDAPTAALPEIIRLNDRICYLQRGDIITTITEKKSHYMSAAGY